MRFSTVLSAIALSVLVSLGAASPQSDQAANIATLSRTFPTLGTPFGLEEGFREALSI